MQFRDLLVKLGGEFIVLVLKHRLVNHGALVLLLDLLHLNDLRLGRLHAGLASCLVRNPPHIGKGVVNVL